MNRQYYPQRSKAISRCKSGRPEGTVEIGAIYQLEPRQPWQVEAWIPRDYATIRNGRFVSVRICGGHLAVVRSLRTGERRMVSDWQLIRADDAGLERI